MPIRLTTHLFAIGCFILLVVAGALYLAQFVATDSAAQALVAQFGYLGILALAVVSGLNLLVPVPAATFTPVFVAAGLTLPLIILTLIIGTTIADLLGYLFGRWSRAFAHEHYPQTYQKILTLHTKRSALLIPFIFLYAAFVPFPNEAIIIPLALIGVRLPIIIIPLLLGTTLNQTLLALGAIGLFTTFF